MYKYRTPIQSNSKIAMNNDSFKALVRDRARVKSTKEIAREAVEDEARRKQKKRKRGGGSGGGDYSSDEDDDNNNRRKPSNHNNSDNNSNNNNNNNSGSDHFRHPFLPRSVAPKQAESLSKYRDRAKERRDGVSNGEIMGNLSQQQQQLQQQDNTSGNQPKGLDFELARRIKKELGRDTPDRKGQSLLTSNTTKTKTTTITTANHGDINKDSFEYEWNIPTTEEAAEILQNSLTHPTQQLLTALTVITNIDNGNNGIFDLSAKVAGVIVTPTMPFSVSETITLDLTVRQKYTAFSTIVGRTDEGVRCFGTDLFEFEAGNPLPPIFPTIAPSAAPTISPFPTPDPETAPCSLRAEILCETENGGRCDDLRSPAGTTCLGSNADRLQFIYIPGIACNGNNTQNRFRCSDENEEVPRPDSAYIRVSRRNEFFFDGAVTRGQIFPVSISEGNNDVDIEIFTVQNNGPGILLQESRMSVRCREEDGLTLLDTFGSLQLVGFRNTEVGSQQIFENIQLSFIAENEGRLNGDLTEAFKNSAFSGFSRLLDEGERRTIAPGGSESFSELFTLNLAASAGTSFDFSFLVNGEGTQSGESCQDTDLFTLRVL